MPSEFPGLSPCFAVTPSSPMTAGTMLARLDRETGEHHADSVRGWTRLVDGDQVARDEYIRQLVMTYGFEAPYEAACQYTPGLAQTIDLRGRWRSGLIAQDLLALGWKPDEITRVRCHSVSPFQDAAEALGWMYAVERATLCHLDVRDELVSRFVDLSRACAYLGAYERAVSRRWSELGVAIDQLAASRRVSDRILAAACEAFAKLREWHRVSEPMLRSVG